MSEIEGIDPGRTMFIPNGVLPLPAPSGSDLREELGLPPRTPLIGTVGMLRAQKAHAVLIEAVASMRTRWPQLHALIVGAGPERGSLERMIDDRNLGEQVHMLGDRADIPDVLHALDVAVCCSDFEGSPLSVMEYMDAGLAIVATAVGGVPDLIDPGVHGLLVPPRDPAALAGAIGELLDDPQRRREMGERARERRRREFDVDVQVRRLEERYLELQREKAPERLA
jgi:glycosyltransferase involved in cell wall biosynthesis